MHTPPVHAGTGTLLLEHATLHAPQFAGEPKTSCSQPFACLLPSQSAKPEAHGLVHTPAAHVTALTWLFEHATAHPPQLLASVASVTSQPFVCLLPSQSAYPASHPPTHAPAEHTGAPMWFDEHDFPQPPQLATFESTFISQPFVCLLPSQSA